MKKPPPAEKEYTTRDEYDDADRAFWQANTAWMTSVGDLEKAAAIVTEYALKSGDRLAVGSFLARFADFVEAGKLPPAPMRKGFRSMVHLLTAPHNSKTGGKGRPEMSLANREWARTHANLVAFFLDRNKGCSLDDALEEVVAVRAASLRRVAGNADVRAPKSSASKIKRDYLRFRRLKK